MKPSDIAIMCELLFKNDKDYLHNYRNRCLLIMQWQTFGRINEVAALRLTDINLFEGDGRHCCLEVDLCRKKVSTKQKNLMFIHRDNWVMCPLHALACYLAVVHVGNNLFDSIGPEASFVNDLMKKLYVIWGEDSAISTRYLLTPSLTSHSARRGSASSAHAHPEIHLDWLNDRGGWKMSTLMTIFNYLSASQKNDGRVGRVISGWNHPDHGGLAPGTEAIPQDEEILFKHYSLLLMGGKVGDRLASILTLVLLLRYEEVKALYPKCALIRMMEKQNVPKSTIQRWHCLVRDNFICLNASSLPLSGLPEDTMIPIHDVQSIMNESVKSLISLQEINNLLLQKVNLLEQHTATQNRRMKTLEQGIDVLLKRQSTISSISSSNTVDISSTPLSREDEIITSLDDDMPDVTNSTLICQWATVDLNLRGAKFTCGSVFMGWYVDQAWLRVYDRQGEVRYAEVKRLLPILKSFLPVGTVIDSRPTETIAYKNWLNLLEVHKKTINDSVIATRLLWKSRNQTSVTVQHESEGSSEEEDEDQHQSKKQKKDVQLGKKKMTRKKKLTASFSATTKEFMKRDFLRSDLIKRHVVEDRETPVSECLTLQDLL
jgi:hypothetical protein